MAVQNFVSGLSRSSWAGSGDTLDKKYGVYLRRKMLDAFYHRIGIDQFADTEGLPSAMGDKVIFKRFIKKARQTSSLSAGVNATPTNRSINTIEVGLNRFGDAEDIPKEVLQTAVQNLPEDIMKMFGIEAAESIEELVFRTISQNIDNAFIRISAVGTNGYRIGLVSGSASTTTTKIHAQATPAMGATVSMWNKALICPLEGNNAGISRFVSTYGSTSKVFTVSTAWEYAATAGARFIVGRSKGISATNKLTNTQCSFARMLLAKNGALPYSGGSFDSFAGQTQSLRGDYIGILTPEQYNDLIGDTVFQTAAQQGDTWKNRLGDYRIVRFMGITFHEMGLAWRSVVGGPTTAESTTYQSAGVLHVANILGQHSYAMVRPEGYGGRGRAGLKVYVKRPGSQTTEQSNDAFVRLGYDFYFGRIVLNSAWAINVLTGATN